MEFDFRNNSSVVYVTIHTYIRMAIVWNNR